MNWQPPPLPFPVVPNGMPGVPNGMPGVPTGNTAPAVPPVVRTSLELLDLLMGASPFSPLLPPPPPDPFWCAVFGTAAALWARVAAAMGGGQGAERASGAGDETLVETGACGTLR